MPALCPCHFRQMTLSGLEMRAAQSNIPTPSAAQLVKLAHPDMPLFNLVPPLSGRVLLTQWPASSGTLQTSRRWATVARVPLLLLSPAVLHSPGFSVLRNTTSSISIGIRGHRKRMTLARINYISDVSVFFSSYDYAIYGRPTAVISKKETT